MRDPPLLPAPNVSSWDTWLEGSGWEIDRVAMTIALISAKLVKLRDVLREWPADRLLASMKLLRFCEVVMAGNCSYVACLTSWAFFQLRHGREISCRHRFPDAGDFNSHPSSMPMFNLAGWCLRACSTHPWALYTNHCILLFTVVFTHAMVRSFWGCHG